MTVSLLGSLAGALLGWLMGFLSLFLILLILIQRGKGGGLTGALGGPGGQSAFGSKAGDTFTVITIVVASIWGFTCAFTMWLLGTHTPTTMSETNVTAAPGDEEGPAMGTTPLPTGDNAMGDFGPVDEAVEPELTPAEVTPEAGGTPVEELQLDDESPAEGDSPAEDAEQSEPAAQPASEPPAAETTTAEPANAEAGAVEADPGDGGAESTSAETGAENADAEPGAESAGNDK